MTPVRNEKGIFNQKIDHSFAIGGLWLRSGGVGGLQLRSGGTLPGACG